MTWGKTPAAKAGRKRSLQKWRRTPEGKAALAVSAKVRRIKRQEWLREHKSTLCCSECGFDHPAALQFHHPNDNKVGNVSELLRGGRFKAALAEMTKCVVLCANCHAVLHDEERIAKVSHVFA